jgi:hypothetical protein
VGIPVLVVNGDFANAIYMYEPPDALIAEKLFLCLKPLLKKSIPLVASELSASLKLG